MKVILYMAMTVNGIIAREDDNTDFVSEVEWESFLDMAKKIGCAIMGKRTYKIMPPEEFVEGCSYIIFTHEKDLEKKCSDVRFVSDDPKTVLEVLEKEGIKQVCLCGGGKLNASFMKARLIDEIYIDIEPKILGKGIELFSEGDFEADLELIETKKLSDNEIQLHYRVKK